MSFCHDSLIPYRKPLTIIQEEGNEENQIWTSELEQAFREALALFPLEKKKFKYEGRIYGRNTLISMYIKRKCGKIRTNNQIASHLQVLSMRKKSLIPPSLLAPQVYNNELLGLSENGVVKFLKLTEDHSTEQYFTDIVTFLTNIFDILAYRRISGEKIAFLAILLYVHEKNPYTDLIYSNHITRGFTCISNKIIPDRMEVSEMTLDNESYYIYKARCGQNHHIQKSYLKNVKHLVDSGDVDLLKVIVRNQARLIVLTDIDTKEILLVLACINDYEPDFTGYQYFRIVT